MDEWDEAFETFVLHRLFALGDTGSDDNRGALHHLRHPAVVLLTEGGGIFVWHACDHIGRGGIGIAILLALLGGEMMEACLAMAEHLHLRCPAKEEEITESGIVHAIDDDVQAAFEELRHDTHEDGTAGIVRDVVYHAAQMFGIDTDGIVVVVVEEGALDTRARGVVMVAALLAHVSKLTRQAWRRREAGNLAPPSRRASRFEALDNIAKAFIHPLLDDDDAVPMVGHADLPAGFDMAAFGGLDGGGLIPFLLHYTTGGREADVGIPRVAVKDTKTSLTLGNDKRDKICPRVIIIMTRIMRTI